MFTRGISEVAEWLVGIGRLQEFLLNEEFVEVKKIQNGIHKLNDSGKSVILDSITAKWNPASPENALTDINISLEKGALLGIIGPVGSGKSSILQAILGKKYFYFLLCSQQRH